MSDPHPAGICRFKGKKKGSSIIESYEKAIKAATRLLRFRPRSVRELSLRLRQKGFDEETCRLAVQSLKEKKLLDDYAFSKFWIENRLQFKPMARRHLLQELLAKGVDEKLIQEALQETVPQDEKALAARLLAARFKQRTPKDPQEVKRRYGFLRRRGFTHEIVSELLERDTLIRDDDA